jgi:hypothetical protein
VRVDGATLFEGGAARDIVPGAKVEVEGTLDASTGELAAEKIEFDEQRISLEGTVDVPPGGLGTSFDLLGVTVKTTALTQDGDGLLDGSGQTGLRRIEVKGYRDLDGTVIATEVEDETDGGGGAVELRGPVENLDTSGFTFKVLGVQVYVPPGADFEPDVDRDQYFQMLENMLGSGGSHFVDAFFAVRDTGKQGSHHNPGGYPVLHQELHGLHAGHGSGGPWLISLPDLLVHAADTEVDPHVGDFIQFLQNIQVPAHQNAFGGQGCRVSELGEHLQDSPGQPVLCFGGFVGVRRSAYGNSLSHPPGPP